MRATCPLFAGPIGLLLLGGVSFRRRGVITGPNAGQRLEEAVMHENPAPQGPQGPQGRPPTIQPAAADRPVADQEFDPDARVDLVEADGGYFDRLAEEQLRKDRRAVRRWPAGPFDPAEFRRAVREPDPVAYGFAVEHREFAGAVGALAAVAKGGRQGATADVTLHRDRVKLSVYARSGAFIETTIRTGGEVAQVADGAPVAFATELKTLQGIARTARDKDQTVQFVLDGAAKELEVSERDGHIRPPIFRADGGLSAVEEPRRTGAVQPHLLRNGLRFIALFARADDLEEHLSTIEVVGGALVGGSRDAVGRFEVKGLAGVPLRIHARFIAPLADALPRLDPVDTALFETKDHYLVADAATCVGIPRWARPFPKITFHESRPACRLLVPRSDLRHWLGRFGAAVSRGRAGGAVELSLPNSGGGARLALRALDASWFSRGKADLACGELPVDGGPPPPAGMRVAVALPTLASVVAHFGSDGNVELLPLPTLRGAAYALAARHEGGSGEDAFAALAVLAPLAPPAPRGRRGVQG